MIHIFVVNPNAGLFSSLPTVQEAVSGRADCEVYVTTAPGDANQFCRICCESHPDETLRFYACGGDGTFNEVASACVGHANASVAMYPCGSGNDFIKYFRETMGLQAEEFLDIPRQLKGRVRQVDVLKVEVEGGKADGAYYCFNVCNFGFDSTVARTMNVVRHIPILGGTNSYTTGVIYAILTARFNYMRIDVDGQKFHKGPMLLGTLGNGQYVGGAFRCSPHAVIDDGLIETNILRTMLLFRFVSLLGLYKTGELEKSRHHKRLVKYKRAKEVCLSHSRAFHVCIDGEMIYGKRFRITVVPKALNVIVP